MDCKNKLSLFWILFVFSAMWLIVPMHSRAETNQTTPVSPQSESSNWEVVETETGIYYTVKKGDTLWDISQRFSDSPYLWPDLWSDNSQIANPHRIYPGERIRLFLREDVEHHTEPVEEEKPVEATTPVTEPEPEPAPEIEVESEPEPVTEQEPELEPELGFYFFSKIEQVGFIRKKAIKPQGAIFRVQGDKKMISQEDVVYVSPGENNILRPGSRYTVYRTLDPIRDKKTRRYIGIQHYLLGVVDIIQTENDYALARVVKSFGTMRVNDLLMPYERKSQKIAKRESPRGLLGEIIIAEKHNRLIGDHMIVFINKGEKDGVRPGQSYSIFFQDEGRIVPHKRKKTLLSSITFGSLLVLHTEKTTSTVFITKADRNIPVGSKFGNLLQ
jgi:hypothetical protein